MNRDCLINDRGYKMVVIILAMLFLAVMAFNINIWNDESFSIILANQKWGEILKFAALDVHPPLYYLLLKAFVFILGSSIVSYKMFSVLFYSLNLLWFLPIQELFGKREGWYYILFSAFMPAMLRRGIEIRMYSLVSFLVTGAIIFCIKYIENRDKKNILFFLFFSITSMYTHYYAVIVMMCVYFIIFLYFWKNDRKREKELLFMAFVNGLLYLPWAGCVFNQIEYIVGKGERFFMPSFSIMSIIYYVVYYFHTGINFYTAVSTVVFYGVFLYGIWKIWRDKDKNVKILKTLSILYFIVPFLIIIISLFIKNIMGAKYSSCYVGVFHILLAVFVARLSKKRLRNMITVFLISTTLLTYSDMNSDQYDQGIATMVAEAEAFEVVVCGEALSAETMGTCIGGDKKVYLMEDHQSYTSAFGVYKLNNKFLLPYEIIGYDELAEMDDNAIMYINLDDLQRMNLENMKIELEVENEIWSKYQSKRYKVLINMGMETPLKSS